MAVAVAVAVAVLALDLHLLRLDLRHGRRGDEGPELLVGNLPEVVVVVGPKVGADGVDLLRAQVLLHNLVVEQLQPRPVKGVPVHLNVVVHVDENVRLIHDLVPQYLLNNILQSQDPLDHVIRVGPAVVVANVPHQRHVPPALLEDAQHVAEVLVGPYDVQAPPEYLDEVPDRRLVLRVDEDEVLREQQARDVVLAVRVDRDTAEPGFENLGDGLKVQPLVHL